MQVLVHIGLNKCASTFIQNALDNARLRLENAGVLYPKDCGPPCQYSVSKHYGFGPEAPEITARPVREIIREAQRRGMHKIILSSEYFSLFRPKAVQGFLAEICLQYEQPLQE